MVYIEGVNMNKMIKLPAALYERLGQHITGFGDTPASVITRLLDHYEGVEFSDTEAPCGDAVFGAKDTTKYQFNGHTYGKGRLVLAVVQQYAVDNPNATYADTLAVFPKGLQGAIGVINPFAFVKDKYRGKDKQRHFVGQSEIVHLSDGDAVVSTEWGIGNIGNFIGAARALGYKVTS